MEAEATVLRISNGEIISRTSRAGDGNNPPAASRKPCKGKSVSCGNLLEAARTHNSCSRIELTDRGAHGKILFIQAQMYGPSSSQAILNA